SQRFSRRSHSGCKRLRRNSMSSVAPAKKVGRFLLLRGPNHRYERRHPVHLLPVHSQTTDAGLLVLRGQVDPAQSPLLSAVLPEVHQHGGFRLGQIGQAMPMPFLNRPTKPRPGWGICGTWASIVFTAGIAPCRLMWIGSWLERRFIWLMPT